MGKVLKKKEFNMGKQPTMGQKKTKEAIAKAAAASKKGGKKKWSKGKVKDKLNNKVFIDEDTNKALNKDVPNMSLITIATMTDRFKIIASLARPLIKQFAAEGKIVRVGHQSRALPMYTGAAFLAKKQATS